MNIQTEANATYVDSTPVSKGGVRNLWAYLKGELDAYNTNLEARDFLFAQTIVQSGLVYSSQANGLAATNDGDVFFVVSTDPEISFSAYENDQGAAVFLKTYGVSGIEQNVRDAANSAAQAALYDGPTVADVADLLGDSAITYTPDTPSSVQIGDVVCERSEGHVYKVAPVVAADHHLTTAGGVKLYVQADSAGFHNVKAFGALGDGATDDTAPIQKCIDVASRVLFPKGHYKVLSKSTSDFVYGNTGAAGFTPIPVHYAIDINKSGLTLKGNGAVLELYGHDTGGAAIQYVFSTAKNMASGALDNIWIEGLEFEFDPAGKVASTYRSMHIVGCKSVTVKDCLFYSSGDRYGATITLQNCAKVNLHNLDFDNVTQGMNFSYVDRVFMSDIRFYNFNEAIDFDRVVTRVMAHNVIFVGVNGEGQCWDMNSVQQVAVSNMTARDAGNVLLINFKSTTQATYAGYVNDDAVVSYTVSKAVSVNGLTMTGCGQGGAAIYAGNTFDTNPGEVVQDVTLSNVAAYQSGGVQLESCRNFTLRDAVWEGAYGIVHSSFGLLTLSKSSRANSELSFTLDNVKIKDVQNAAKAIRVSQPDKAVLRGVWVENYPLEALEISSPQPHALISIRDASFLRTVDTTTTGTAVRFTSFPTSDVIVDWDNIRITEFTTPIVVSGAGEAFPKRIMSVGDLDSAARASQCVTLYQDGYKSAYFTEVKYSVAETLAANGADNTYLMVKNSGTTVSGASTGGGIAAGAMFTSSFDTPEALGLVEPGSVMYLQANRVGAGQTLTGFAVHCHMLEFLRV